jgi:hypothetical protein
MMKVGRRTGDFPKYREALNVIPGVEEVRT